MVDEESFIGAVRSKLFGELLVYLLQVLQQRIGSLLVECAMSIVYLTKRIGYATNNSHGCAWRCPCMRFHPYAMYVVMTFMPMMDSLMKPEIF